MARCVRPFTHRKESSLKPEDIREAWLKRLMGRVSAHAPAFHQLVEEKHVERCHQRVNIFVILNHFTIGQGIEPSVSQRRQVTSTNVGKI